MKKAPNFCLPDLDGTNHCLKDYFGQVVLINFWSSECPQSARVDKEMSAYQERFGTEIVFLRIASNKNETLEKLKLAASERAVSLVLWDACQEIADLYAALTTPHCYIVDTEGLLCYQGAFDDVSFRQRNPKRPYVTSALEAVLDGRQPQSPQTPPYGCTIVRQLADSC